MNNENEKPELSDHTTSASPVATPKTGFSRLLPALLNSFAGMTSTFRSETAFRQELAGFVILFPAALVLGQSAVERALLIAPLFLVLILELVNTALEHTVDRWGPEYNEHAKLTKDAGSAAVFLGLTLIVVTWTLVLFGG